MLSMIEPDFKTNIWKLTYDNQKYYANISIDKYLTVNIGCELDALSKMQLYAHISREYKKDIIDIINLKNTLKLKYFRFDAYNEKLTLTLIKSIKPLFLEFTKDTVTITKASGCRLDLNVVLQTITNTLFDCSKFKIEIKDVTKPLILKKLVKGIKDEL